MGAIYRRELGSFFNSAIGPVFLTVFYLGSGVLFWLFCLNYARTDMSNYFAWMRLVMVLILPLLTMRLLSEERAQKTDQGLLTAPVSLGGIVLGKYFAALTVYAMGIAIVFVYAILLSFFGTVAWSIVFSNFIVCFHNKTVRFLQVPFELVFHFRLALTKQFKLLHHYFAFLFN